MCSRKDIGIILEQLQHCNDAQEKRRILKELDNCKTCTEKPNALAQEETRCKCEEYRHIEFRNIIEHVKQHRVFEKPYEKK